jgi:hypothetical protein
MLVKILVLQFHGPLSTQVPVRRTIVVACQILLRLLSMVRLHIPSKSKSPHIDDVDELVKQERPVLQPPQPDWNGYFYRYLSGDALAQILSCQSFCLGQIVWVCKSKGAKKALISSENEEGRVQNLEPPKSQHRYELFLRATIIEIPQGTNRIRVQYPQGSTYLVQPQFLIPILDADYARNKVLPSLKCDATGSQAFVLVYPETSQYRRACILHTAPSEHFIEIGCAEGITCHRVYERSRHPMQEKQRIVLGMDKSSFSIQIAQKKYTSSPNLHFVTFDILQKKEHDDPIVDACEENDHVRDMLRRLQRRDLTEPPPPESCALVIAVDINGNRDLDPVLQCIRILMHRLAPRLIIVKSRSLRNALVDCELQKPDGF